MPKKSTSPSRPSVSKAEWQVLQVLWEHGPLPAREVYARLPAGHGWHIKTLKTLLTRLVAKGAAGYEKAGKTYIYRALFPREETVKAEVKSFARRVLGASPLTFLLHFVEHYEPTEDELAKLSQWLKRKGKKK